VPVAARPAKVTGQVTAQRARALAVGHVAFEVGWQYQILAALALETDVHKRQIPSIFDGARWTFHFTPTSASWLNAVEGFFAKLTKRRLKRGVFLSVVDLQAAINRFLVEHNAKPKPFTWTADPDKIIAAVRRGHQVLDSIH